MDNMGDPKFGSPMLLNQQYSLFPSSVLILSQPAFPPLFRRLISETSTQHGSSFLGKESLESSQFRSSFNLDATGLAVTR
jgi:hypothetical protein